MPPKRKASASAKSPPHKEKKPKAAPAPAPPSAKVEAAPKQPSPAKAKPLDRMTVSDIWASPEYVSDNRMTQEGFAKLITALSIEEMSFESIYLTYLLSGSPQTVDDVMVVCSAKPLMQRALDSLGCRQLGDLPTRLRARSAAMQGSYDSGFQNFFRWLFEMGKAIAALNNSVAAGAVRTVPLNEGVLLMEAVLGTWSLMPQMKEFCTDKFAQPFSKDLWTQISRFAHMTATGQIAEDLSNYDDDDTGGGSAWPCAIDEFVEYVQEKTGAQ